MTNMKDQAKRRVENGRLVYYRCKADSEFWDDHWTQHLMFQDPKSEKLEKLGFLKDVFFHHLPKGKPIVEAGCGPGQIVFALRKRGYDVEGIEWGKQTVEATNRMFPGLPVKQGNVCVLDAPDGYYGGYISLGVIEHRQEGPEPFLVEAYRVLENGGIAIFTVPWFNPIRRIKGWLGCFNAESIDRSTFYQYAYTASEIKKFLRQAGFIVVAAHSSKNTKMGFDDEIPWIKSFYRNGLPGKLVKKIVIKILKIFPFFGHSYVYICKKSLTLSKN